MSHTSRKPRSTSRLGATRFRLSLEPLERRELLDATGLLWSESPNLSLSFATEGVDVAGEPNQIDAYFDANFQGEDWQGTILSAFQRWAVTTNANIGFVEENGAHPLGAEGPRTGDSRFGDVRVAARPLARNVHAVSVSHDSLISGTWAGDVIFNTNGALDSLDQLYSVALHEAGHVFGLSHSAQEDSPMHVHGISDVAEPSLDDEKQLRALYGTRNPDQFDAAQRNDSIGNASVLRLNRQLPQNGGVLGSVPTIAFADLGLDDSDYYNVEIPEAYSGNLTIRLRTQGTSLLSPVLTVLDRHGSVLAHDSSTSKRGDLLTVTMSANELQNGAYLRIDNTTEDVFAIGSYSLAVVFDEINRVDVATLEKITRGEYVILDEDEIESYFEDDDDLFNDDEHSDDEFESAQEIEFEDSEELRRFEIVGSLTDSKDVDYYEVESPESMTGKGTMLATVRAFDGGSVVPEIEVLDDEGELLRYEILGNDGHQFLIQMKDVTAESEFILRVAPPEGAFSPGSYELTVVFRKQPIVLDSVASGVLWSDESSTIEPLDVEVPQLMHFALSVDQSRLGGEVAVDIRSATGTIKTLSAPAGNTVSTQSVLILPGTYNIVATWVGDVPNVGNLSFDLKASVVSDPIGLTPVRPTELDFSCPGVPDSFCYPGGIQSSDPFLWEDFLIDTDFDPATPIDSLVGDWWVWYWNQLPGDNPPLAANDAYSLQSNSTLVVDVANGLLKNDVDPNGDVVSAIVSESTAHGKLEVLGDGSFRYEPHVGFVGMDEFRYRVRDQFHLSESASVLITVLPETAEEDFNRDGTVDAADLDLLTGAVRVGTDLRFDIDRNGVLDEQDRKRMIEVSLGSVLGDSNLDGVFNSTDLVYIFQQAKYENPSAGPAGWSDGDWNGDGVFNTSDLVAAFQAATYEKVV